MPDFDAVTVCTCCKRRMFKPEPTSKTCWECSGRPTSWSQVERRALAGLRDKACPHDIPGGA